MVDRMYITRGKIEGSTYIILSTDKSPTLTKLNYGIPDSYIKRMIQRRKTCKVPLGDFVRSPWTDWLKEKDKNY
jgi:hypothetical protein